MSEPRPTASPNQLPPGQRTRALPFYVARQPIFDRNRDVHAYEMLFRGLEDRGAAHFSDGSVATAQLITHGWLLGGFDQLSGGRWLFVNFTRDLLLSGAVKLFQQERDVVEILEDVPPDAEVLGVCGALVGAGYRVALDDVQSVERLEAFKDVVTLAKVDFMNQPSSTIRMIADCARRHGIQLLAEKVETAEELVLAERLGFDFFQGYYLSRPESLQRPALRGLSPAHTRLLRAVSSDEVNIDEVARAVEADPSLTYKLLRSANSAARSLNRRITSVREAVVLFGEQEIRRAASFVVMGAILDDSCYMLHGSVTLARFCDELGHQAYGRGVDRTEFYLVGLLASIDELLGQPMGEAVSRLPLSESVTRALVEGRGPVADALELARAYMHGDWTAVEHSLGRVNVTPEQLSACYLRALVQSDAEMDVMTGEAAA